MSHARTVISTCCKLAQRYGFFMINENMVFYGEEASLLVWINPNPLENTVKIYLPDTKEGELAMIRSIITYLKLWLKLDYAPLT